MSEEKATDLEVKEDQKSQNEDETTASSPSSERVGEVTSNDDDKQPQEKTDVEVAESVEDSLDADHMDLEVTVDPAIVEKLSNGFLQKFLPTIAKSKSSLDEVLSNQKILIETVEQENAKFRECQSMEELTQTMVKARKYYNKLMTLKKDMGNLHDKSGKLKKRAVKIQQQRTKEELQKAQQKEREHEKERMLAARVVRHTDS